MPQCFVLTCGNYHGKTRGDSKIIYHMMPTSPILKSKWIELCRGGGKYEKTPVYSRVCSEHFSASCYQRDLQHELLGLPLRKKLKPDAIPDLKLPEKSNTPSLVGGNKRKSIFLKDVKQKEKLKCNESLKNRNKSESCVNIDHKDDARKLIKTKETNDNNEENKIKIPMRSSIRIAKRKSLELLSDLTTVIKNKKRNLKETERDRIIEKIKFMRILNLKFGRNEHVVKNLGQIVVSLSQYEFELAAGKQDFNHGKVHNTILNKMHVMDEVREGCDTQPSSPGHAEQRVVEEIEEQQLKENGLSISEISNNGSDDAKVENNQEEIGKNNNNENDGIKIEAASANNEESEKNKNDDDDNPVTESLNENEQDEIDNNHIDDDSSNEDSMEVEENTKRKLLIKNENNNPAKKMKSDIEINFNMRDKIFQQYIDSMGCCNNLEQMQIQTEQILAEVRTLNELAKEKEREWNNIIHLKKMKEELLLRLQRQKQVMMINEKSGDLCDIDIITESPIDFHEERQSVLKPKINNNTQRNSLKGHYSKQRNYYKTNYQNNNNHQELNGQNNQQQQNKQRNVVDVQSIIADYRQRHPETVPRRGRRIRSVLNTSASENGNKIGVLNFANLALGSGSQVRQNMGNSMDATNDIGLLMNPMDGLKGVVSSSEFYGRQIQDVSFKDMLVQCAKLSQSERQESQNHGKGGFPEVTVHPVTTPSPQPTNSLLHGILTKAQSKTDSKTTFSPTLARLLTAPERSAAAVSNASLIANSNVSISDILSCSKARNEITITPVGTQYEATGKGKNMDEEEADDSVDRLVIDEGGEVIDARTRTDNGSDAGDEVPQCQGCNQKPAQFVCAGCGNQWYCSRECQVSAWDEHSEVCSG